jgi:sugar diacid utilization regulator
VTVSLPATETAADALELLRLLAAEAPETAYTRWLAGHTEANGRQLSPEVVEAYELARSVRDTGERRRRREHELAALYATAGDLSSLRDTDKVLGAIVRRARELLTSDVAYLTLIDGASGDTTMRVSEGMATGALLEMRLASGTGVSGLVAKTAEPFWTPDYLADRRIIHVIDDLVAEEGLSGIVGVPLLLADEVIGVLFAADRVARVFAPEEVALLSSLGDHAAIAINNARLFEQAKSTLEELTRAHAAAKAHTELIERSTAVHERLADLVLRGADMSGVVAALAEVLGADVLVVGPDDAELAGSPGAAATLSPTLPGSGWRAGRDDAFRLGRTVRVAADDGPACWVTPILAGADRIAVLLSARAADFDDAELRSLERAAQVTALLLLTHRSVAATEQRVRGELLDDLLSSYPTDEAQLQRRAQLLGVDLDAPHVVVSARPASPTARTSSLSAAVVLSRELGGVAGEHDGSIVCLLPAQGEVATAERAAERVSARLSAGSGSCLAVGAAGPAGGVGDLVRAHRDAARCERILLALDRTGATATPRQLGIYGLLFSGASREQVEEFLDDQLGPLLTYDRQHGTQLVPTLRAWFASGGSLARAAQELFLHVNTLRQRLARIGELLGEDWRGERALELHVAVSIHDIIARI